MDDIRKMKFISKPLVMAFSLMIGMIFAGCTFKAELESRLIRGHASDMNSQQYGGGGGCATTLK